MKKAITIAIFLLLSLTMASALKIQVSNLTMAYLPDNGMDKICQDQFGTNYKALMGYTDRNLTEDWVLQPNTQYTRADGTVIAKTNSKACFDFPLTNSISDVKINVWTGLEGNCTNKKTTYDCFDWLRHTSTEGARGVAGTANAVDIKALGGTSSYTCDHKYALYCVEQGAATPVETPKPEVNQTANKTETPAEKPVVNNTPAQKPAENNTVPVSNVSATSEPKSNMPWIIGIIVVVVIILIITVVMKGKKKKPF